MDRIKSNTLSPSACWTKKQQPTVQKAECARPSSWYTAILRTWLKRVKWCEFNTIHQTASIHSSFMKPFRDFKLKQGLSCTVKVNRNEHKMLTFSVTSLNYGKFKSIVNARYRPWDGMIIIWNAVGCDVKIDIACHPDESIEVSHSKATLQKYWSNHSLPWQ